MHRRAREFLLACFPRVRRGLLGIIPAKHAHELMLCCARFGGVRRAVLPDAMSGTVRQTEALVFPRFQQLDAVRRLMVHAREHKVGTNYLIQHSAGSGKSNTIGWLAHHAINLHDAADKPVFDTAIIVTDRIVLDRQLQDTVSQFEQTQGVVHRIDGSSRQLKEAIGKGARIIVTTIQKFSTDHLKEISGQSGRTFAVIVDEAHSSQSGKAAQAMTNALTREATSSEDDHSHGRRCLCARPNRSFRPNRWSLASYLSRKTFRKCFHIRDAVDSDFNSDVRWGSKADIGSVAIDVRSSPESRHRAMQKV